MKPKKTAVPVNWTRSLLILLGFFSITLIAYIVSPTDSATGLMFSIGLLIAWLVLTGLSVKLGQWVPLFIASIYFLAASAIRLCADNALQSDVGIHSSVRNILMYTDRMLAGFAYIQDTLPLIVMTGLTLLTLGALVIVLDRSKPKIIEDSDPIDW